MNKLLEAIYSGDTGKIEEQMGRVRTLGGIMELLENSGKICRSLGKVLKKKCYFLEQLSPLAYTITIKDVRIMYFCNQVDTIKYKEHTYKIYTTTEEYIGPKLKYYFRCLEK